MRLQYLRQLFRAAVQSGPFKYDLAVPRVPGREDDVLNLYGCEIVAYLVDSDGYMVSPKSDFVGKPCVLVRNNNEYIPSEAVMTCSAYGKTLAVYEDIRDVMARVSAVTPVRQLAQSPVLR